MKLVSLKRTPAEKADDSKECAAPCSDGGPDYPWGTQLRLEEEQLDALGLGQLPNAGADVGGQFAGKVIGMREEERDGKVVRSLEIQITDLGFAVAGPSMAERMYGKDKKA
jgi:hypothetical protein